jgi:hypothetical protein
MAKKSLTAKPSSHNDIESLAGLLEDNLQYHSTRTPSYKEEYLTDFNLTIGLSFTAIMVDGSFVSTHKAAFNRFLDSFSFYHSLECNSIKPVAMEAATILYEAAIIFPRLKPCRELNAVFREKLGRIVRGGILDVKDNRELSDRLLKTMLVKDTRSHLYF